MRYTTEEIELAKDIYKILISDFINIKDYDNNPDGLSHNDDVLYVKGCAKRSMLLSKMFYNTIDTYEVPIDYINNKKQ